MTGYSACYDTEPGWGGLECPGEMFGANAPAWFNMLYQVLLGESRGPRFGSFIALYGIEETRKLIADALAGELMRKHEEFLDARKASKG